MKRYSDIKKIFEELTPEQKSLVDRYVRNTGSDPSKISAHVMKSDTIRIPLHDEDDAHQVPHPDVVSHLEKHGFKIPDFAHYKAGHSIDANDRITSIGKALHKTGADEELKKKFVNDPSRAVKKNSDLEVAISYHPYHVAGMSTDRGWSSCMDMDEGCNSHYLKHDIANGTHVAYLVRKHDTEIKDPIARIALKPFKHAVTESKPYDPLTHERHKEGEIKEMLSHLDNQIGEKTFEDFAVSPNRETHYAILKDHNLNKHRLYEIDPKEKEIVGVTNHNSKEDAMNLIKKVHEGETVKKEIHSHVVLRPEGTTYGTPDSRFEKTVHNWAKTNFPLKKDARYTKIKELYNDDNKSTIVEHSPESIKEIGEAMSKDAIQKTPETRANFNKLYNGGFNSKELEDIYNHADNHSKQNHTKEQREFFLSSSADRLVSGNYSTYKDVSHDLVNRHIKNLLDNNIEFQTRIHLKKANAENYAKAMDYLHNNDKSKYVDGDAAGSPHIRTKDIDKLIDIKSSYIDHVRSDKLEPHHIDRMIDEDLMNENVVASPHYNEQKHERYVDKKLNNFKLSIDRINSLEDTVSKNSVREIMGKDMRSTILALSRGGLSHSYSAPAKHLVNEKIVNKLIDFSKEHADTVNMSDDNYHSMRFSTPKGYNTEHVKNELNVNDTEVMSRWLMNKPSAEHIDIAMDKGLKFKSGHSLDTEDEWKHVFKSKKARDHYARDIKIDSTESQKALAKSVSDEDYDVVKNRKVDDRMFMKNMESADYSVIDHHIKAGNKMLAQHYHDKAIEHAGKYKDSPIAEKNQRKIDGMK